MTSNNESVKNIITVALVICLVCSILVSTATVVLKPLQDTNKRLEKKKNVLMAGNLLAGKNPDVEKIFAEKIHAIVIDLKTGLELPKEKLTGDLNPEKFDIIKVSQNPTSSQLLPSNKDIAGIKRIPLYSLLYFAKEDNKINKIIFPIYGQGLWSTLYGFIALDQDLKTIGGITFYEHGETPGLGGEVDNLKWKATWKGKIAFDQNDQYLLKVIKGKTSPNATSEVDGLSGATLTTRGVDNLVRFWFGPDGFGPFLAKLRKEGVTHE